MVVDPYPAHSRPHSKKDAAMQMFTRAAVLLILLTAQSLVAADKPSPDPKLKGAYRRPPVDGWTVVHLEGSPSAVGYQHGYLLSAEITDMKEVADLELAADTHKKWPFFRHYAEKMMWPRIESEYREELAGIAEGARAAGGNLDLWDIVALNGLLEWGYFNEWYNKAHRIADPHEHSVPEHCSAIVATGSWTTDGRPVIAHNNWSTYLDGTRWTYIFDIVPARGHRIVMDGVPGMIASADDFGVNDDGIMITETTISGFHGYDTTGVPEFVRGRKAMQYASTIDDFSRIMSEGNNGGYANNWLVADRKNNEVASLELGLKNVILRRTKDGYFLGANFPQDAKLMAEETTCDPADSGKSCFARKRRWEQIMETARGKISSETAKQYMGDHTDPFDGTSSPSERTLCGHIDLSPRGSPSWQGPYGPAGTVQSKVADASLAAAMSFLAATGHSCGIDFRAAEFLARHPEYGWQKPLLHDMPAGKWTLVKP
jgi:hypothetical protein